MSRDLIIESRQDGVAVIILNRPEVRNALSRQLIAALTEAVDRFEADPEVGAMVLAGGAAFCAGADIVDMAGISLLEALVSDFSGCCDRLAACGKPLLAAVEGYALGGGCELIEMCDLVIAAEDARFGHPEILLGTLSGAGGTQRLARAVGRAKAMDLVLTGRQVLAAEAERIGLISRVVPKGETLSTAIEAARQIVSRPPLTVRFAKEAVNIAVSHGLAEGLRLERRLFQLSLANGDLPQGIQSFLGRKNNHF
ncbi:MAG TPA: enoyl-CoA hydratase-related protein [Candidatus Sulfotelmatobacter sp.]|jgi:enoyl-CoA hydratase|nr:enoyl-CoA hydratase-related protein [Candidatus Sulfotelmatobacter sp.]